MINNNIVCDNFGQKLLSIWLKDKIINITFIYSFNEKKTFCILWIFTVVSTIYGGIVMVNK